MSVQEFWRLTPKEFEIHAEAYALKTEYEYRSLAWLAWNTANCSRAKHLPAFEKCFNFNKRKGQSVEDQIKMAEQITAAFGGKDKRKK